MRLGKKTCSTGPFDYLEYNKDTQTMVLDIERYLTRYFKIPPGE